MAKSKRPYRPKVQRDSERSLHDALVSLVAMADAEEECFCKPCRRLRELGRALKAAEARSGMPGPLRPPSPPAA